MYKLLSLKKLGVYWDTQGQSKMLIDIAEGNKLAVIQEMTKNIARDDNNNISL